MIDEILKKIDEDVKDYEKLEEMHHSSGKEYLARICQGRKIEAKRIKEIVLSEQSKQPIGNTEKLTIGDKIRESNESLVKWILNNIPMECSFNLGDLCNVSESTCEEVWLAYLNQPYKE